MFHIPPSLTLGIVWIPGTDPAQGSWYEKYVIHVGHVGAQEFCFLTVEFFHSWGGRNLISCRLTHTVRPLHYFGIMLFHQVGLDALIKDNSAMDMKRQLSYPHLPTFFFRVWNQTSHRSVTRLFFNKSVPISVQFNCDLLPVLVP